MADNTKPAMADMPAAKRSSGGRKRASAKASRRGAAARSRTTRSSSTALLRRGRKALNGAVTWAGEAGATGARAVRRMQMPDQTSLQHMIDDHPVVVGAVGLGIGLIIGSMMPSMRTSSSRSSSRR